MDSDELGNNKKLSSKVWKVRLSRSRNYLSLVNYLLVGRYVLKNPHLGCIPRTDETRTHIRCFPLHNEMAGLVKLWELDTSWVFLVDRRDSSTDSWNPYYGVNSAKTFYFLCNCPITRHWDVSRSLLPLILVVEVEDWAENLSAGRFFSWCNDRTTNKVSVPGGLL